MGEVVNASRQFRERKWARRLDDYLAGAVSTDDMIRETLADIEFGEWCREKISELRKRRVKQDDGA